MVSRTRDVLGLTAFVFLCFGISTLGGKAATAAVAEWYPALRKPSWTPPGWVFGPVWTLLYPLVAVAGWLAWREGRARLPLLFCYSSGWTPHSAPIVLAVARDKQYGSC